MSDLAQHLRDRRQRLAQRFPGPVLLWSGRAPSRNFAANRYPFRASSHFLYFGGLAIADAVLRLGGDRCELFWNEPDPEDDLWHGESSRRATIAAHIGADAHYPLADLATRSQGAATVGVIDPITRQHQSEILGRGIPDPRQAEGADLALVQAIVAVRLMQDPAALAELRRAGQVAIAAHRAGMQATATAKTEANIRAAMEAVILGHNATTAYNSIVTTHGEVLHNEHYEHKLQPGDLVLADVGAEVASGWASDITRTWPVSGHFSRTQKDIYDIVLAAHDVCIAETRAGVEYRKIHFLAAQTLTEGLVDLGILRGQPEDLVDQDAHALFFPHGVGHLLGLDVHDMEDLGDWAGYAAGRQRSDRFGLGFLRLDRPLKTSMVVTIEPGFYQVPAILNDPERRDRYAHLVNWERLAQFGDVRGIRIEDDVWVGDRTCEVLTADLPTDPAQVCAIVQQHDH